MLILGPKDEFDKEYGELYLKGFMSEENYGIAKRQFYRCQDLGIALPCQKPIAIKKGKLNNYKVLRIIIYLINRLNPFHRTSRISSRDLFLPHH